MPGSAVTVKKKSKSVESLASSEAGQHARRHGSDPLSNSEKSKQLPQNAGRAATLLPLVASFFQEQEFDTMRRATQTIPTSSPCAKRVTQFITSGFSSRSRHSYHPHVPVLALILILSPTYPTLPILQLAVEDLVLIVATTETKWILTLIGVQLVDLEFLLFLLE